MQPGTHVVLQRLPKIGQSGNVQFEMSGKLQGSPPFQTPDHVVTRINKVTDIDNKADSWPRIHWSLFEVSGCFIAYSLEILHRWVSATKTPWSLKSTFVDARYLMDALRLLSFDIYIEICVELSSCMSCPDRPPHILVSFQGCVKGS